MVDGNLAMNFHNENISEEEDALAYEAFFIRKGNLLIANFDGWKITHEDEFGRDSIYEVARKDNKILLFEKLKYESDWGLLMPVVEKIVAIRYEGDETAYLRTFGMRNHDGNYMVRFNWCSLHEANTLLWATYLAVVDFIEMQNAKNSEQKAE